MSEHFCYVRKDPVLEEVVRKEQWDHRWFGEQACGEFVCNTHLVKMRCAFLWVPCGRSRLRVA